MFRTKNNRGLTRINADFKPGSTKRSDKSALICVNPQFHESYLR